MAAQSNVNLEKCALFSECGSWTVAHWTDGRAGALAYNTPSFLVIKIRVTSFKSVSKFICVHSQ